MAQAIDKLPYTMKEIELNEELLEGIGYQVYVYHDKKVIFASKFRPLKHVTIFDPVTNEIQKVKTNRLHQPLSFNSVGYSYKGLIYFFLSPDKTTTQVITLDMNKKNKKKKKWTQLSSYEGMPFVMWGSTFDYEKGMVYLMNQSKCKMKLILYSMDLNCNKWSYLGKATMSYGPSSLLFHEGDLLLVHWIEKNIYGYNIELGTFDPNPKYKTPTNAKYSSYCFIGHELIHVGGYRDQLLIESLNVSTGEGGDGVKPLWTRKGAFSCQRSGTNFITSIPTEDNEVMVFANYPKHHEVNLLDPVNDKGLNSVYVLSFSVITSP